MNLLGVLLGNAATATILAALVAVVALRIRRPALLHTLWLAVLLDLVAPPLVPLDLVPGDGSAPIRVDASMLSIAPGTPAAPSPALPIGSTILLVWLAGALAVTGLALVRGVRLARSLDAPGPRYTTLERVLERHARRMRFVRVPRLRVVTARISPLVVPRLGGSEIVMPRGLVESLEPREIEAILVHELAHVRRRDAWVRIVEIVATIAFWWHPVVYAVRAALRRAEESCCDERVVELLPGHAPDYALGLVKTLEFLSSTRARPPVWATGAAPAPAIERRLNMILDRKTSARLPRPVLLGLALVIVAALVVFPASGGRDDDETERESEEAQAAYESDLDRALHELERDRAVLERRHAELEAARAAAGGALESRTELKVRAGAEQAALEQLRAELEAVRAGREDERKRALAESVHGRIEERVRAELEAALAESVHGRIEEHVRAEVELATAAERVRAELEAARAAGGVPSASDLARQNEDLRVQVERLNRRVQELERRMAASGGE